MFTHARPCIDGGGCVEFEADCSIRCNYETRLLLDKLKLIFNMIATFSWN